MDNSFKRIFSAVTLVAMMAWTAGPALQPANAATLMAGDLIKSEVSSSVYYYGADGKRYVFPNEKTYKTWYSDFSGVKTITKDELAAISIGGNIVYRPGSRLIKITTDPKVYAVSPNGTRHWIKTEEAAMKLYGTNWAQLVDDVPDAFFFNYPTEGVALDGTMHPDGTIIKYASSSDLYLVWEGKKRKIVSDDAFSMNMLQTSQIVTSSDSVTYPNGDDITSKVDALVDTAQLNATPGDNNTSGGALSVALAPDTPAATEIPAGTTTAASDIKFTAVNFTAGSSDVTLKGLSVLRTGLSVDSDLTAVKLYDANMVALGSPETFNANHKAKFNFTKVIPAGATQKIWIAADSGTTKTGRIVLGIESASDIDSDASSVSGSFPVNGNQMTQVLVNVGSITIEQGPNNVNTATTVDVDEKQYRFMQARITAGSTEKVKLTNITFKKGDDATFNSGDLANFTLYNDTKNEVVGTAELMNDKVSYTFSPALELDKGESVLLSLKADVLGGSSRTVSFALRDNSTWLVQAYGSNYGFGVTDSTTENFGNGTADDAETASVTVNTGSLTVSKGLNSPAADEIAQGASNQRLGSFRFTAKGEAVKIDSFVMSLNCVTLDCTDNSDVSLFKLVDKDGKVWAGPYDPVANAIAGVHTFDDAADGQVTFSDSMIFPVGETELFVEAKIASTADDTGTIQVGVEAANSTDQISNPKGQTSNKTATVNPGSEVLANTQTVAAGSLVIKMGANPLTGNMVVNAAGAMVAEILLDPTASGEDIKLTSLTLTETGTGAMTNYSNMTLKDADGNQVGDTEEAASATTVVFNIDNGYVIPKNEVKKLYLYMDLLGAVAGETFLADVSAASAVGADSGATVTPNVADATTSPTQTWSSSGDLVVTVDADTPSSKQLVSGATGLEVARYKLSAYYEDINVTKLNLFVGDGTNAGTLGTGVAAATTGVKVYKGSTLLGSSTFGIDGKATVNIADDKLRIMKDDDAVISIKIDTNVKTAMAAATVGQTYSVGIAEATNGDDTNWSDTAADDEYSISAVGVASGTDIGTAQTIDNTLGGDGDVYAPNSMTVHRGVLTVSLNSTQPSTAQTAGANKEVMRIDFTATGDDITIDELEFCVTGTATSIAGSASTFLRSVDESVTYATLTQAAHENYWNGVLTTATNYYPLDPGVSTGSCFSFGDDTGLAATDNIVDFATDIVIAAGTTKTVKVMGQTTGAGSDETLQLALQANPTSANAATANGIEWHDTSTTVIGDDAALLDDYTKTLPLYGPTLNY